MSSISSILKRFNRLCVVGFTLFFCFLCVWADSTRDLEQPYVIVIGEPSDGDLDIRTLLQSTDFANEYSVLRHVATTNEDPHLSPPTLYRSPMVLYNPHLGSPSSVYDDSVAKLCPSLLALAKALHGPDFSAAHGWPVGLPSSPQALPAPLVIACAQRLYDINVHSPLSSLVAIPVHAVTMVLTHSTPIGYTVHPYQATTSMDDHTTTHSTDTAPVPHIGSDTGSDGYTHVRVPTTDNLPSTSADTFSYTVTPPPSHMRARTASSAPSLFVWGHPEPFRFIDPSTTTYAHNQPNNDNDNDDMDLTSTTGANDNGSSSSTSVLTSSQPRSRPYHWGHGPAALLLPLLRHARVLLCACHGVGLEREARNEFSRYLTRNEGFMGVGEGDLVCPSVGQNTVSMDGNLNGIVPVHTDRTCDVHGIDDSAVNQGYNSAYHAFLEARSTASNHCGSQSADSEICTSLRAVAASSADLAGAGAGWVGLGRGEIFLTRVVNRYSDDPDVIPTFEPLASALVMYLDGHSSTAISNTRDRCSETDACECSCSNTCSGEECLVNGLSDLYRAYVTEMSEYRDILDDDDE